LFKNKIHLLWLLGKNNRNLGRVYFNKDVEADFVIMREGGGGYIRSLECYERNVVSFVFVYFVRVMVGNCRRWVLLLDWNSLGINVRGIADIVRGQWAALEMQYYGGWMGVVPIT
jgi:hypothetical protein